METLYIVEGPFSHQKFSEPLREDFFGVLTEQTCQQWVLKRWRTSITEPMQYEIFRGWVIQEVKEIAIQEEKIKTHLRKALDGHPLPGQTLNAIISAAEIVKKTQEKDIRRTFLVHFYTFQEKGLLSLTEHPLEFLLGLGDSYFSALKTAIENRCGQKQKEALGKALEEERYPEGALALKVIIDFKTKEDK